MDGLETDGTTDKLTEAFVKERLRECVYRGKAKNRIRNS